MNEFTKTYLNIITEARDRFNYYDIIKAVKNITNDCKDAWGKGDTGSKVLALLKESGSHTRGNERIRHSSLLDENDYEVIANDDTYITMYWKGRSKSGSEFDNILFRLIWTYCSANDNRKLDVAANEVGSISYAVWKALNSRNNKIEKNLKEFDEKDFDYHEEQKMEDQYFEMKKKEEESAKTTSKISEYIDFIRIWVNICKKDPTLKDNENLFNMIKQYVDYLKSNEIYELLNDDQKIL